MTSMKMMMLIAINFSILLLHIFRFNSVYVGAENTNSDHMQIPVPVRVVLDMNSSFSAMLNSCLDMAITDFYSSHSTYETRLQLHKKEVKNALDFNLAVLGLVEQEQVLAILGTQGSMQEELAAAVGEAAMVPIVSLTRRSSALSNANNSYIFSIPLDHAPQAEALAAICKKFEWPEAVILYEDTADGNQFLSRAIKVFQDVDITLTYIVSIPISADGSYVEKELNTVNAKQTRVFLVHLNPELGSLVFALADAAGMMSEGYAWIATASTSIFLNSLSSETRESMDGVLGIRPYVFPSKILKSFQERWKRNMLLRKITDPVMDLNIYGLWAYDTVTALAIAVEKAKPVNGTVTRGLGIGVGPRIVSELSKTKFEGLAGEFELVEGKLEYRAYEIFNIIGNGERRVGFWSPERGITRDVSAAGDSKSKNEVKKVVWPGDSVTKPKGWAIPPTGSLRVGVPWRSGFVEFIDTVLDPETNETLHATGFAVDVFLEALKELPFPVNYTFHCMYYSTEEYSSYDGLLQKGIKDVDIVVADTTIWASRAQYADFSLPYSESGIVLVVKNKKPFDMWIFIRPLRWDLWLAILVACMLMGLALCILENQGQAERSGTIYWSPIAILAFQDRNMVSNKWSVFVLVCWLFMAFILMQSFTANLSAILTLDQLKFSFSQYHYIGFQEGSFMRSFLIENLKIDETRLRSYSSIEEFHNAMSKGSKNGGIDAIFDELPYMKLLLNRYKPHYKIVGPTYRTDGFGFAFPTGSRLVSYFSRAILNVTQGPKMSDIERKNFGPGYSSQDPLSSVFSQGTRSLTIHDFAGLFLLTGSFILSALFCSQTSFGQKLTQTAQHFIQNRTPQLHPTEPSDLASDSGSKDSHDAPAEGGDVLVIGDEAQQEAEQIPGTAESSIGQAAGEEIQNEEFNESGVS